MIFMHSRSKTKQNTPIYFNTNCCTEIKLVPIIMNYCLLQFNFLGVRLHGGSRPNFNFININHQIFQRNRKVHLTNCLETNFYDIPIISLRVIRRRIYSWYEVLRGKKFLFNFSSVDEINIFFHLISFTPLLFRRKKFIVRTSH